MIRKMIAILILTLYFQIISAPPNPVIYILRSEEIRIFDPMLYAFQKVESNFDTDVVNHLGYTGILQEGSEMISEANRICKMTGNPARFKFPDAALDSLQSVNVWYVVQTYWNPQYSLKKAVKVWNPLASKKYYLKIKKEIISI
jgi:hypothetical protein